MNHSIYQTINTIVNIPPQYYSQYPIYIYEISDSLFNANTADIEFIVRWHDSINGNNHARILDDANNVLFSIDSFYCQSFYTTNGYKMNCISDDAVSPIGIIFSLPGGIPCDECVNHNLTAINSNLPEKKSYFLNSHPNPAFNSVTIEYELPIEVKKGEIVFYDINGKEMKRYNIDNTFNSLLISTSEMQAGTYFYKLMVHGNQSIAKSIIVIN